MPVRTMLNLAPSKPSKKLIEILKDLLSEDDRNVVELPNLLEEDANFFIKAFETYNMKKEKVISEESGLFTYTLYISKFVSFV